MPSVDPRKLEYALPTGWAHSFRNTNTTGSSTLDTAAAGAGHRWVLMQVVYTFTTSTADPTIGLRVDGAADASLTATSGTQFSVTGPLAVSVDNGTVGINAPADANRTVTRMSFLAYRVPS